MARLISDSKLGFYPTSTESISKIFNKVLIFSKDTTILDSCCGEGVALHHISNFSKGSKTFGVEIDKNRAIKASSINYKILNSDALFDTVKSNNWCGLNFLNPPYGQDNEGKRVELNFFSKYSLCSIKDGVLILVINPSSADEKMAKSIRNENFQIMGSFYDKVECQP
jgi:16S rRNA G1207 methylase RsmC